ncbi:VWA domain-containing protein [Actinobaculum sp. 352]|nr:hypothetical protein DDD63_11100 [Actinobaculum sp. 313]RTE49899.1 VWA domain-containing protein [Actinobaculum sp. 352]
MVMPWLIPVVLGVAALVGVVAWQRHADKQQRSVKVAHTLSARSSELFRTRLRRYRAGIVAALACAALVTLSSSVVAARPSSAEVLQRNMASRDIVLCLDISGSVIQFDSQVVEAFSEIVDSFEGERVALVIFNSSARTVFPLTDDYDMIQDQLEIAATALDVDIDLSTGYVSEKDVDEYKAFAEGTLVDNWLGSSLVGDGLVSCSRAFDYSTQDRSRTVILATDNIVEGSAIFELEDAVEILQDRNIRINGLFIDPDPGSWLTESYAEEMEEAVTSVGGNFFYADDADAGDQIVKDVQAQDAADLEIDAETIVSDHPGIWPVFALLGVGGIIGLGWRLRL